MPNMDVGGPVRTHARPALGLHPDLPCRAAAPTGRRRFVSDCGHSELHVITLRIIGDLDRRPRSDPCPAKTAPDWTAVKINWNLTVDDAEKTALTTTAQECPNTPLPDLAEPS